jgi:hypothetical protein
MKEQQPKTPREPAKDFIASLQTCRFKYAALREMHPSTLNERYSATIGDTIFNGVGTPAQRFQPLEVDQVGIWRLNGNECWGVFALREIYDEVWREGHQGKEPDEFMEQGRLFSGTSSAQAACCNALIADTTNRRVYDGRAQRPPRFLGNLWSKREKNRHQAQDLKATICRRDGRPSGAQPRN